MFSNPRPFGDGLILEYENNVGYLLGIQVIGIRCRHVLHIHIWMDGWMDRWMGGWINKRTDINKDT